MTLPLVIVNPASADGATRENWPKFASDLRTHFGPFTVAFTEGIGHGRQLAAEAAKQGKKLVIACGGDGTISEVANGIIESNTEAELGILPGQCGSQNMQQALEIIFVERVKEDRLGTGHSISAAGRNRLLRRPPLAHAGPGVNDIELQTSPRPVFP